jgi:arylsulfatase A-like enzyme
MGKNKKPNVLVFFTDQQRWDTTGIHGNPMGLTPVFDDMAIHGTNVEYAFTPQPVCGPARACLQTGMYATAIHHHRNGLTLTKQRKRMADCFREAGYYTGYIGKWHLAPGQREVAVQDRGGYEYWLGANSLEHTSTAYNTVVYDGDNHPVQLPGYRVDALTDAAIRFLDDCKHHRNKNAEGKPFFLFLSFLEPHFQNCFDDFPAPDIYNNSPVSYIPPDLASLRGNAWESLSGYYGMVRRLDEALGRIRDALKSLNLSDNTILLFASDHGCHFKTRNSEYKRSCHDSSIRIPMALYGGPFTGGGCIQELISLVDIMPTLLDACEIKSPADLQGHSFLPLIHRSNSLNDGQNMMEWPQEIYVQISESEVGRAIRTKRWKYSVEAPDKNPVLDSASDIYQEAFLYDLDHDPYELHNLIHSSAHQIVCETLSRKLADCAEKAGEKRPLILPAEKHVIGQRRVFEGEEQL